MQEYMETIEPSLFRHSMSDKSYLDVNSTGGVRLELMFLSCWNEENDGGRDYKSHVAPRKQAAKRLLLRSAACLL